MKKSIRLAAAILTAAVMLSGFSFTAYAAVPSLCSLTGVSAEQASYTPGVTVGKPSAEDLAGEYGAAYSEAGFKVTFTFAGEDPSIQAVQLGGNMNFYSPEDCAAYAEAGRPNITDIVAPKTAYEYRAGMVTAQNNAPGLTSLEGILYDMQEVEPGVWSISLPLPAQQYVYKYILTYENGRTAQTDDPANPADVSANVVSFLAGQSIVYVGNAVDAPEELNDLYPVKEKYQGTLTKASVMASSGVEQALLIYLPYNYNTNKTYKTLYVSHGSNGSETDWFGVGNLKNILDNLYKDGKLTDLIVVSMDNNTTFNNLGDLEDAARNIADVIVPYMEANYPVSTDAADRAVFGLSAGGSMTETLLQTIPEEFSVVGISSAGRSFPLSGAKASMDAIQATSVSYYCGELDWRETSTRALYEETAALGGDVSYTVVSGAHDWMTWGLAIDDFLTNRLWQSEDSCLKQAYQWLRKGYTDHF